MVKIYDCRKKEVLMVRRVGGDIEVKVLDISTDRIVYDGWYEVKNHSKRNAEKILSLFEAMKNLMEKQE